MKKVMRLFTLLFVCISICGSLFGQTVDTIEVYSPKMKRKIKNVIILPASYDKSNNAKYPVVYLLHGHGGNYSTWVGHTKKDLPQQVNNLNVIVVCPDGQNSWYWDSPVDKQSQFETYVSKELVAYIDKNYKTIALPKGRAIAGFSMGGHGGLWLGIRHPDVFGACGSMSGGVDIRPFPENWNMKNLLGSYKQNTKVWDEHTVITEINKIKPDSLAIIIDCGKDDFFYQVNEELHKQLLSRNISHDYIVRPGAHNHEYWNNALDYQMLFFQKFFIRK